MTRSVVNTFPMRIAPPHFEVEYRYADSEWMLLHDVNDHMQPWRFLTQDAAVKAAQDIRDSKTEARVIKVTHE